MFQVRERLLRYQARAGQRKLLRRISQRTWAGQNDAATTTSLEAQVEEKVNEALQQVKDSQEKIQANRRKTEDEAEKIKKDQRFRRVKDALDLKEQGHNLDPSAGHSPDEDVLADSKAAQTRKNAASDEAQVPDGQMSLSKSICQRLLALEEAHASRPRRKLISRAEPVPQLTHHYAAAAWWAVA